MEKKIKKIPFNLYLAKAIMTGVKEGRVITRNGEIVESLTLKISYNNCFIVGDILCPDGRNLNFKYLMNGMISDETESCFDLFLEVPGVLEFKKGDVVFQKHERCSWLSLLKDNVEYGQEIFTYDYVDMYVTGDNKGLIEYDSYSDAAEEIRLATPEEKQMLIDALKKDNSEKVREYLKRFFGINAKPKFNTKDWVLIRSVKSEKWDLSRFGYYSGIEEYPYSVLNGNLTKYCIPYNEQTKHLLGTTDDWEG